MNASRKVVVGLTFLSLGVLASSCGGGSLTSGTSGATNPSTSSGMQSAPITETMVTLDGSVPQSMASIVTQVITPSGTGSLNNTVPVNLQDTDGQSIAMGLDANQQVRVAAVVSSSQTAFSADSTATALLRLLLGNTATAESATSLDATLQDATGYADLVAAINGDFASGTPILADPTTLTDLATVLATVSHALAQSPTDRSEKTTLSESAATPLPITIIQDLPGSPGVYIDAGTTTGRIFIGNATLIPWSATSSAMSGSIVIPPNTLASDATALAMSNAPFSVTIAQDASAQTKLAYEVASSILDAVLLEIPVNGCVESALKTAAATTTTGVAGGSESWEAFQSQLKSDLSSASVSTVLTQCAPMLAAAFDIQAIMPMLEATAAMYEDVAVIPESILLAPEAFELSEAYTYWGKAKTVQVCATFTYDIDSCAQSFVFDPTSIVMAPGAVEPILATDSVDIFGGTQVGMPEFTTEGVLTNGQIGSTGTPSDLTFKAVPTTELSVTPDSSDPGFTISAGNNPGGPTTAVSIAEASTGASTPNPLTVSVMDPVLSPSTQTLPAASGERATVFLEAPGGGDIVLPVGITWKTSAAPSTLVEVGQSNSASTWEVGQNASPGTYSITAYTPQGSPYGAATINVVPLPSGTIHGSVTLPDTDPTLRLACSPGSSQVCETSLRFSVSVTGNQVDTSPAATFSITPSSVWATTDWVLLGYPYTNSGIVIPAGQGMTTVGNAPVGSEIFTFTFVAETLITAAGSVEYSQDCELDIALTVSGNSVDATALAPAVPLTNSTFDRPPNGDDGTYCDFNPGYDPIVVLPSNVPMNWTPSQ